MFLPCSHVWIRAEWSGVPAVHRGGGRARRQRARQDHPPPGRAHGRPARSTALNGSLHLFFSINTGNAVFSPLRSPSQHFLRLAPRNRERGSRSAAGHGPGASARPQGARSCVHSANAKVVAGMCAWGHLGLRPAGGGQKLAAGL